MFNAEVRNSQFRITSEMGIGASQGADFRWRGTRWSPAFRLFVQDTQTSSPVRANERCALVFPSTLNPKIAFLVGDDVRSPQNAVFGLKVERLSAERAPSSEPFRNRFEDLRVVLEAVEFLGAGAGTHHDAILRDAHGGGRGERRRFGGCGRSGFRGRTGGWL